MHTAKTIALALVVGVSGLIAAMPAIASAQTNNHTLVITYAPSGNSVSWHNSYSTAVGVYQGQGSCTVGAGCSSNAVATNNAGTSLSMQRASVMNANGTVSHVTTFMGPNGRMFSYRIN
ncbi:MAG TPA: hypothetical protein VN495_00505 [Candidatus Paceibacterota bacterium]|nr:hypothetical protein [Candidatus Paceibacterota bacterium]